MRKKIFYGWWIVLAIPEQVKGISFLFLHLQGDIKRA